MQGRGFPEEILLLFTVLIWVNYLMILLSSPKNKVNQWCCICGFLLSIGVFKEYLVIAGIFSGIRIQILGVSYELESFLNSVLTAVLYYVSMPCVMIFSMYFCHLDRRRPGLFRMLSILVFLPVFLFGSVYPWSQTREIANDNPEAFTIVGIYNLLYGVLATIPILVTLVKERKSYQFRQRRMVSVIALLPLWYWLITLFLFHILELEKLYKLWQGNLFILVFLFFYYLWHLFREGIWGIRLNREYFDWTEENIGLQKNVSYFRHMLKGELAKISWCIGLLRGQEDRKALPELEIIDRSVKHIEEFLKRSGRYTGEIALNCEMVNVDGLFEEIRNEWAGKWKGSIEIFRGRGEENTPLLFCDYHHIKEVLNNLTANAIDAMGEEGVLTLSYRTNRKNTAMIQVEDTGPGIDQKELPYIFQPYYSGKDGPEHLGPGLSYCRKVLEKHQGSIQVKKSKRPSGGAVFVLYLPIRPAKRRKQE
ncbi:MAG: HAMP domain-containing sensor histidine kinase [Candidatus Limivivens sp.]|nr:HAMP domain-containing sensor histidine kinase [Candidatus Limivivens sp.]